MKRALIPGASVAVSVLLPFAGPVAAPAQTFWGLAGGLNYAGPVPASAQMDERFTHGFAAQASLGRELSSRFGVRLDALVSQFAFQQQPFDTVFCIQIIPSPCGPPAGFVKPVGVAGLVANGVVTVDPPEYPVRCI